MALREPRADPAERADVARFGAAELDERRAPGGGSGCRQIGQLEMKRLWRQKLGGTRQV
jgi:hypothetical protein